MGRGVIAAYRPKAGKAEDLLAAVRDHLVVLREQHLATERAPFVLCAKDGTIIEAFEWVSEEAIAAAHSNPAVGALWARFNEACEIVPLASTAECQEMFAEFDVLAP